MGELLLLLLVAQATTARSHVCCKVALHLHGARGQQLEEIHS